MGMEVAYNCVSDHDNKKENEEHFALNSVM